MRTTASWDVWNAATSDVSYVHETNHDPQLPEYQERIQVVTNVGDRVHATPYLAHFPNGWKIKVDDPGAIQPFTENVKNSAGETYTEITVHGGRVYPRAFPQIPSIEPPARRPASADYLRGDSNTAALADARRGIVQGLMYAKELKQSLRMVRDRAAHVADVAINAQRRSLADYYSQTSRRGRLKAYDRAANWHLEVLFGWTPFISETINLMKAINTEATEYVIGKGRAKSQIETPLPSIHSGPTARPLRAFAAGGTSSVLYLIDDQSAWTGKLIESYRSRTSLKYKYKMQWGADMGKYGLNPVDAMFDAVPLSFLLNFSTNVQNFLTASTPFVAGDFVTGSHTQYDSIEGEYTGVQFARGCKAHLAELHSVTPGRVRLVGKASTINREVFHREPEPELVLRSILDVKRSITLAAIGIQNRNNSLTKLLRQHQFKTKSRN